MKIVYLNTHDNSGGAGIAAYRLFNNMQSDAFDCRMLVQQKVTDNPRVQGPLSKIEKAYYLTHPTLDQIPLEICSKTSAGMYSPGFMSGLSFSRLKEFDPDIVHMHWINGGFVSIKAISKLPYKVVWTFHDMWPFTGGCHYDGNCGRFQINCGNCPILNSSDDNDLSRKVWRRKKKLWNKLPLNIIAPSHWLSSCVSQSGLFRNTSVRVVPNGIDINAYKPLDKEQARSLYNLSNDKKIILFGAFKACRDSRKGFDLLVESLNHFFESYNYDVQLVVFGASWGEYTEIAGHPIHYVGHLYDASSMAAIISAADVFVAPSRQDNLPNTILEALACGTPCVAFGVGGISDLVEHKRNGYLADPFQAEDIAIGIDWVLNDEERWEKLSELCRKKAVDNFDITLVTQLHQDIYKNIASQP